MNADQIGQLLVDHAERLRAEIAIVWECFDQTNFLGDNRNLPHAHHGYLMGAHAYVDVLSTCDSGSGGNQTERMCSFLEEYVQPGKPMCTPFSSRCSATP